jgi:hypothetical protein
MANKSIRFNKVNSKSGIIAKAEVQLFKGVFLRGWNVFKKKGEIWVWPPFEIIEDESTGKKRFLSYLRFESKDLYLKWVNRVKEAYIEWEKEGYKNE